MTCCAVEHCLLPNGSVVQLKDNGDPRHRCAHCRKGMHGASCGVQWVDKEMMAKKGYCIPASMLHPEGKKEAEAFNNDGVIVCFKCLEALSKTVDKQNERDSMRYCLDFLF